MHETREFLRATVGAQLTVPALGNLGMSRTSLLFLIALCGACTTITPAPSIEELEAFDSWVYSAFPKADLSTASSIKGVGKLLDQSSVPYEAGHAEGKWNVTTYRFDGLTIVAIVQEAEPQKALASGITITSSAWPLVNGLAVGAPVSSIEMPVPPSEKPLRYCGMNDCVEFGEEAGRISKITLSLYAE